MVVADSYLGSSTLKGKQERGKRQVKLEAGGWLVSKPQSPASIRTKDSAVRSGDRTALRLVAARMDTPLKPICCEGNDMIGKEISRVKRNLMAI